MLNELTIPIQMGEQTFHEMEKKELKPNGVRVAFVLIIIYQPINKMPVKGFSFILLGFGPINKKMPL